MGQASRSAGGVQELNRHEVPVDLFRRVPDGQHEGRDRGDTESDRPDDQYWQKTVKNEAPQHKMILTQRIYLGVDGLAMAEIFLSMRSRPCSFSETVSSIRRGNSEGEEQVHAMYSV